MVTYDLLVLLTVLPMLSTLFLGFKKFNALKPWQKNLMALITYSFLVTIFMWFLGRTGINTYPLFHLYAIIELSFFFLIYQELLGFRIKKFAKHLIIVVLFILGIINAAFLQKITSPNTYITVPSFILWTIVSIFVFLKTINNGGMNSKAITWFNIGVFIYCTSSFLIFALGEKIATFSYTEYLPVWQISILFIFFRYLSFHIAIATANK